MANGMWKSQCIEGNNRVSQRYWIVSVQIAALPAIQQYQVFLPLPSVKLQATLRQ
jgi:hypothetical protein